MVSKHTSALPSLVGHDGQYGVLVRQPPGWQRTGNPSEFAEILTAYYLGGKSQAEIAHLNGIPLGTVKSRLFHAKKDSALHVRPKSSGSMKKETS